MIRNLQTSTRVGSWALGKAYLSLFLPLLALIGVFTAVIYYVEVRDTARVFEADVSADLALLEHHIAHDFESVASDLMILSEGHDLVALLENGRPTSELHLA